MRIASLLLAVSLSGGYVYAATPSYAAPATDSAALDSPFSVQANTQVPGKVLKPGNYRIAIKDHLSDRAILQVVTDSGKVQSTFLGIFHSGMQSSGTTGPITIQTLKGSQALRGFTFPGGGTVEFAYPKAEAAALATNSTDTVLAIDPESDNLKAQGASLSKEDAQVVTLWSLQATKVSSDGKTGIAASKFVSPGISPTASAPAVARTTTPAPVTPAASSYPSAASTQTSAASVPAPRKKAAPAASSQVASARRPALSALPHTASNMPLLLLTAILAFALAGFLRVARSMRGGV